jgi:hypothetical protein
MIGLVFALTVLTGLALVFVAMVRHFLVEHRRATGWTSLGGRPVEAGEG